MLRLRTPIVLVLPVVAVAVAGSRALPADSVSGPHQVELAAAKVRVLKLGETRALRLSTGPISTSRKLDVDQAPGELLTIELTHVATSGVAADSSPAIDLGIPRGNAAGSLRWRRANAGATIAARARTSSSGRVTFEVRCNSSAARYDLCAEKGQLQFRVRVLKSPTSVAKASAQRSGGETPRAQVPATSKTPSSTTSGLPTSESSAGKVKLPRPVATGEAQATRSPEALVGEADRTTTSATPATPTPADRAPAGGSRATP